jgi:outer membrane protein
MPTKEAQPMTPIRSVKFATTATIGRAAPSELPTRGRWAANIAFGAVLPLVLLSVSMRTEAADDNPGSNGPDPFSSSWNISLGAGVVNLPRYPGSADDFTRVMPMVSISYDRYFLGTVPGSGAPAGLGAYLLRTEHWTVGVDIGATTYKPRRASDAPILSGWGDIPGTVRGGMFANYTMDWLSINGSVSDAGHQEGVIASLGIAAKYHATSQLTLSIGPEFTWVNNQYAMTFFGIDTAQSEIAGVAPYQAKGGINSVGGKASARYALTDKWSISAFVSYGVLQGDAADSPVTSDKDQKKYGALIMYRF